jgi:transcriptional regulator with XRE-family HTH domain
MQLLFLFASLGMNKTAAKLFLIQFGNHIRGIRFRKNITQAQVAKHCQFDISVISRIERGVVNISVGNANLIADALGLSLRTFLILLSLYGHTVVLKTFLAFGEC